MADSEAVQRTNDDATSSKKSAVDRGYWTDAYLQYFARNLSCGNDRKAPEIHLGYFTRIRGLRILLNNSIKAFCKAGKKFQIINLGSGFDTLYWRLKDELDESSFDSMVNFIEDDLPGVTSKKSYLIKRSKILLDKIVAGKEGEDVRISGTEFHGPDYHLISVDFTNLEAFEKKLIESNVDFNLPTIFIAECVLVYIETQKVNSFLSWCCSKFTSALVFLNHEQVNMFDRFGEVMLQNLSHRGCGLPGVEACRDKKSQEKRFIEESKWNGAQCWTMHEVYYDYLPRSEIDAAERLEIFDERELLKQLFEHYCITIAWRNASDLILDTVDFWNR